MQAEPSIFAEKALENSKPATLVWSYAIGVLLLPMGNGMRHTVVETPEFRRAAREAAIGFRELMAIVDHLARHPGAGDLIPGTGGARKVRFRGRGRGKSGGSRVITAYADADTPVFLLTVFAKGDRIDMNARERRALRDVISRIVEAYRTDGAQRQP